ncbi:UDP-N-acetylmuramoyl-L-alanyl-D-glutamate--2,6-diaminopimelate ligase [Marinospirillum sp. MEB164]|uniref:UDP-N-acetylmuramoyl-L-alanyl-D-glutamate--2,6-diaminopimelate ligase n=1 Tax=Marinospirillum alkalitolerans TaxID=3123374 RepID=A0ABW8PXE4_9GAMM
MPVFHVDRMLSPEAVFALWPELAEHPLAGHLSSALAAVTRLVKDSRQVQAGDAFINLLGPTEQGQRYQEQALAAGARVLIVALAAEAKADLGYEEQAGQAVVRLDLPDLKARLGGWLTQLRAQHAARHGVAAVLSSVAVTGTNGKSSVAHFLAQAYQQLDQQVALVGTLGYGRLSALQPATHTTPDLLVMHDFYQRWAEEGMAQVVLEASSHALDQGRLDGLPIQTAVFTNLTRDHLDYHPTFAAYGAAKRRLFERPEIERGVICIDDAFGQELAATSWPYPVLTYSLDAQSQADLKLLQASYHARGIRAQCLLQGQPLQLELGLLGDFNLANVLAVALVLWPQVQDLQHLQNLLNGLQPVPGRMQCLETKPQVVVDYAHTPDALAQALQAVRRHTSGQLWCVFGCGGDRDTGKRPLMGAAAARYADQLVVTDDNPRTEDPALIRAAIMAAAGSAAVAISDRAQAIAYALQQAGRDDVVLIAGKGHETTQQLGAITVPFSDVEVALQHLESHGLKAHQQTSPSSLIKGTQDLSC